MKDKFVFISRVDVYDDKVFTQERADKWTDHMIDAYELIYQQFDELLTGDSFVRFFLNESLLDEVVIDAIIGMRKITDSDFNSIEDPNSFKIISYLAYWWMRHKPVSLHFPDGKSLEDVDIIHRYDDSDDDHEYNRQKFIWRLKHINEIVAVQMAVTYIFDFNKVLCDSRHCIKVKQKDIANFCFADFDEMRDVILSKLTYYFCYRALSPKTIEHFLEGYTFHPAWGLTGPQWSEAIQEGVAP